MIKFIERYSGLATVSRGNSPAPLIPKNVGNDVLLPSLITLYGGESPGGGNKSGGTCERDDDTRYYEIEVTFNGGVNFFTLAAASARNAATFNTDAPGTELVGYCHSIKFIQMEKGADILTRVNSS